MLLINSTLSLTSYLSWLTFPIENDKHRMAAKETTLRQKKRPLQQTFSSILSLLGSVLYSVLKQRAFSLIFSFARVSDGVCASLSERGGPHTPEKETCAEARQKGVQHHVCRATTQRNRCKKWLSRDMPHVTVCLIFACFSLCSFCVAYPNCSCNCYSCYSCS